METKYNPKRYVIQFEVVTRASTDEILSQVLKANSLELPILNLNIVPIESKGLLNHGN